MPVSPQVARSGSSSRAARPAPVPPANLATTSTTPVEPVDALLDGVRLPILPAGPYISSDDTDDVQILEEPPEHMKKRKGDMTVYEVPSDSDEEVEVGRQRAGHLEVNDGDGPSSNKRRRGDDEDEVGSVATPSRNGKADRASSSSSAARRERESVDLTMPIIFDGDDEPLHVPLGWGGLGIPDNHHSSGPSNRSARVSSLPATSSSKLPASNGFGDSSSGLFAALDLTAAPVNATEIPGTSSLPRQPPITVDDHIQCMLEIIPDICLDWARTTFEVELVKADVANAVARVVGIALEIPKGYPRANKDKGLAVSTNAGPGTIEQYKTVTYQPLSRRGWSYESMAAAALDELFPRVPLPHQRTTFTNHSKLFIPTYFALLAEGALDPLPYQELKTGRKGKNKQVHFSSGADGDDTHVPGEGSSHAIGASGSAMVNGFGPCDSGTGAFQLEYKCLQAYLLLKEQEKTRQEEKARAREQVLADGGGHECQCCFSEEIWGEMFQCAEGHLFCRECATRNAEIKLGEQKTAIVCMDMSACTAAFTEAELERLLSAKSLQLYHRLKQASELELAGLEGLESCPYCPYSAIIDNPDEKLFYCRNPECTQTSCRKCKREEHLPKSCEEMEADRKLDQRHAVEDAMSEAMIRKCPKCEKAYVKDSGCNKITTVTDGYAHFDRSAGPNGSQGSKKRCILWDNDEAQKEHNNVIAARDAAQAVARRNAEAEGFALAEADIAVDAGQARNIPPVPGAGIVGHMGLGGMFGIGAARNALDQMRQRIAGPPQIIQFGVNAARPPPGDFNFQPPAIDPDPALANGAVVIAADVARRQLRDLQDRAAQDARARQPLNWGAGFDEARYRADQAAFQVDMQYIRQQAAAFRAGQDRQQAEARAQRRRARADAREEEERVEANAARERQDLLEAARRAEQRARAHQRERHQLQRMQQRREREQREAEAAARRQLERMREQEQEQAERAVAYRRQRDARLELAARERAEAEARLEQVRADRAAAERLQEEARLMDAAREAQIEDDRKEAERMVREAEERRAARRAAREEERVRLEEEREAREAEEQRAARRARREEARAADMPALDQIVVEYRQAQAARPGEHGVAARVGPQMVAAVDVEVRLAEDRRRVARPAPVVAAAAAAVPARAPAARVARRRDRIDGDDIPDDPPPPYEVAIAAPAPPAGFVPPAPAPQPAAPARQPARRQADDRARHREPVRADPVPAPNPTPPRPQAALPPVRFGPIAPAPPPRPRGIPVFGPYVEGQPPPPVAMAPLVYPAVAQIAPAPAPPPAPIAAAPAIRLAPPQMMDFGFALNVPAAGGFHIGVGEAAPRRARRNEGHRVRFAGVAARR